jgi:hypothetical protein
MGFLHMALFCGTLLLCSPSPTVPSPLQAAQAELSLIAGLKRLAGLGVTLLPMELKQLGLGAAGAGKEGNMVCMEGPHSLAGV